MDVSHLRFTRAIREDFDRVVSQISEDPYDGPDTLGIYDVLKAHYLIANHFYYLGEGIAGIGPRDLNLLHSALYRQFSGFGEYRRYTDIFDISATLLFGLVKDHPFRDANKRTGLLSTVYFLYRKGYIVNKRHSELEDFIVDIADGRLKNFRDFKKFRNSGEENPEIILISRKIKSMFRKVDKRYYVVTYRELDNLLENHGCWLAEPSNNYINVYKRIKKKEKGLFRSKIVEKDARVARIGFPGWGRQVNQRAIQSVLNETGLTAENGIDSQVFFKDVDPMHELIAYYNQLLQRLAYK